MGGGQCGRLGELCCPTGDPCRTDLGYYCDSGTCRRDTFTAEPGEYFCDEDGQPTDEPTDNNDNPRPIFTAIGCIPIHDKLAFTSFMLTWAVGIGGGLSFLLLTYGGFLFMTSQGDPHRAAQAKTIIGAAITGILMLIFSVTLLRIIGVNILNIL